MPKLSDKIWIAVTGNNNYVPPGERWNVSAIYMNAAIAEDTAYQLNCYRKSVSSAVLLVDAWHGSVTGSYVMGLGTHYVTLEPGDRLNTSTGHTFILQITKSNV